MGASVYIETRVAHKLTRGKLIAYRYINLYIYSGLFVRYRFSYTAFYILNILDLVLYNYTLPRAPRAL